jgi:hypothetical protein
MSIYQNALDIQSASNLSGVIFQFARDMVQINQKVRESVGGTEQVNRHPVCRLYAEQIAWLTGAGGCENSETYRQAHDACQCKVKEEQELQSGRTQTHDVA